MPQMGVDFKQQDLSSSHTLPADEQEYCEAAEHARKELDAQHLLAALLHRGFLCLERKFRAFSYIPTQPPGHIYWIGVQRNELEPCKWFESPDLASVVQQAWGWLSSSAPWPDVVDQQLAMDAYLVITQSTFQKLSDIPHPDGTPLEVMLRERLFTLHMAGDWWTDWRLYRGYALMQELIRRAAEEVRHPHSEEFSPWKRVWKAMVPVCGGHGQDWWVSRRPEGIVVGEQFIGTPEEVAQMTPVGVAVTLGLAEWLPGYGPAAGPQAGTLTDAQERCTHGK